MSRLGRQLIAVPFVLCATIASCTASSLKDHAASPRSILAAKTEPESATKAGTTVSASGSNLLSTQENKTQAYDAKALHRLDFKVVGKSCAVCLFNIQRRVKTLSGVIKDAVQLKKPYAAVIIYDSSKVSQQKIFDKAKEGLKDVQFNQIEDISIPKVPLILVPKIGNETAD